MTVEGGEVSVRCVSSLSKCGAGPPTYASMSNQSPQTFEEIVESFGQFVYNVALRMMGDPHDAEDVTQEAFIDAFRAWDRFRGESQVSTWLYRITVNRSLMKLRKEKKRRELTQTGIEDMDVVNWTNRSDESPERAALSSGLRWSCAMSRASPIARPPRRWRPVCLLLRPGCIVGVCFSGSTWRGTSSLRYRARSSITADSSPPPLGGDVQESI